MKQYWQDKHISADPLFYYCCALLMLTVPFRWLLAAFTGAVIHELFHIFAVCLCGKKIDGIEIGVNGAEISVEGLEGWQAFLCLAAGPIGSFSLMFFFRWIPLTAFFGIIQGIFNLFPVLPLDGGRMLLCLLQRFFDSEKVWKIMKGIEMITCAMLFCLTILISYIFRTGMWFVLALFLFLRGRISGKIPCKLLRHRVQ